MKKVWLLVTVSMVFFLSSCGYLQGVISEREDTSESTYYENWYDQTDHGYVDVYFLDRAEVPYMKLEDFLDLAGRESMSDEFTVSKTDSTVTLSYVVDTGEGNKTMTFTYDYTTGKATVNDIEFFSFNEDYRFYSESYHSVLLGYDSSSSGEVTFDLAKYGLQFVRQDGEDLVEMHLGNLFFASQYSQLYYTGSEIYLVYFEDFTNDALDSMYYNEEYPLSLQDFAMDFYAFYFDYFYGLNFEHPIGYYYDQFYNDRNTIETDSTQTFYQNFDYYLKDFNDMHLWLYFEGYYGETYSFDDSTYTYSGRALVNKQAEVDNSDYCSQNYSGNVTPSILFLQVNSIDDYTPEVIAMDLNKYYSDQTVDVVFDFTCNPGGYIYSMHDMIAFFTSDPYEIIQQNFKYGSTRTIDFGSQVKKIDANLYILTSGQTYSAANILTAYAKANDLATIIGEPSTGGSSTVDYVLGPGGMVVAAPNYYHYTDSAGDVFEYGVPVDYEVQPTDTHAVISLLYSLRTPTN